MSENRLIEIGNLQVGGKNNICDVPGVLVGHSTINDNNIHTGITAILPHKGNMFREKVVSACYSYNGFGKSMGLLQIEELGTIETPILLTNTLSIGKVSDGLISYMIKDNPEIGVSTSTVNPVVMECNDGTINDIQKRVLNEEHVFEAINSAQATFKQGNIGGGTGMKCSGFKGGIGSSSRIVNFNGKEYVVGVLVNSNFGSSNGEDLIIKGRRMGDLIRDYDLAKEEDKGSIIIVVGTNLPLDSRQLKRVAKRTILGLSRTGSYGGNGSGDIVLAFSTENKIKHFNEEVIETITRFSDNNINRIFKATVEATEEAILNSMFFAEGVKGFNGKYYKSLMEYENLFDDLLVKNK